MIQRPVIAITIGDFNGVGPEVIVKALSKNEIRNACRAIIIGPKSIIQQQVDSLHVEIKLIEISELEDQDLFDNGIEVLDIISQEHLEPNFGQISVASGKIAARALESAINLAMSHKFDAITTGPISKEALNLAGYHYPGQTEFLAEKTHTDNVVMVLLSGDFRVGLVTTHCPISRVSELLTKEKIVQKLQILHRDLSERFNIANPKIAVAALNPHAGEGGLFGSEEQEIIKPAVQAAQDLGVNAQGPYPADTLFARLEKQRFDAYLTMYHDQGLIPLKMKSFGKGVNYTAGLPIIRTSPDHGTAFDIAGKGLADSSSMEEAIKLAVQVAAKTNRS